MKAWLIADAGACVVEVTPNDVVEAFAMIAVMHPHIAPTDGAAFCAAVVRKAWVLGCNPGGAVDVVQIPDDSYGGPMGRLMDPAELHARGLVVPE